MRDRDDYFASKGGFTIEKKRDREPKADAAPAQVPAPDKDAPRRP